jgi:predicted DNA-binding protein (MmcQ/YjbR family)
MLLMTKALEKLESDLRDYAMSYPDTTEDFPWGHRAIKVRGKVFAFLNVEDGELTVSVKLPQSRDMAHDLPWTEPTHYGMGKHGWVTAHLRPKEKPPLDLIRAWIDESFRAIAPKTLVKKMLPAR